jgi:signal peptidase I
MAEPYRKSATRDTFESLVVTVILAIFGTTFVVQAFKIPTGSMEETLLIGDHLLVNKIGLRSSRGSPACCRTERSPQECHCIQIPLLRG